MITLSCAHCSRFGYCYHLDNLIVFSRVHYAASTVEVLWMVRIFLSILWHLSQSTKHFISIFQYLLFKLAYEISENGINKSVLNQSILISENNMCNHAKESKQSRVLLWVSKRLRRRMKKSEYCLWHLITAWLVYSLQGHYTSNPLLEPSST